MAEVTHMPVGSFGVNGAGTRNFSNVQSIAVEESTGNVYVYDAGTQSIYKYNAQGEPAEFTGLKTSLISNVSGVASETQIAVDGSSNPSDPARGDIYVANTSSVVIYGSDGRYLGELNEAGNPGGENCGVAVDASGNVYVGLWGEHVNKYTPTGKYVSTLYTHDEMCYVAADGSEAVYTFKWYLGPVKKHLASEFNALGVEGIGTQIGGEGNNESNLAVDRIKNELYIDYGSTVEQFDSTGKAVGKTIGFDGSTALGVDGANGELYVANGGTQVDILGPPVIAPDVALGEPSGLQPAGVTLNGTVNPSGVQVTSCQFEYGTTAGYGQVASCEQQPGSGESPVPVTAKLTGLNESTTYHYRLKAANAKIAVTSKDQTFTTYGPPTITPAAVSGVTRTTATLHAVANPHAYDTTYRFEYGTDTKYGTSVPVPDGDIGSGTSDVEVSAELSGLEQGTTYHYRLVAVNSHGETVEEDQTFTTEPAVRIAKTWASEVKIETARIHAEISPRGLSTTYHFEYGADTKYGMSIPVPEGTIGEKYGEETATVSESLYGLAADTTYHFRVVATNANGTDSSPDQTFTTFAMPTTESTNCPNAAYRVGASSGLPDCRAYEMVSPVEKNGTDVLANFWKGFISSKSGDRIVFGTRTGFGDTHGSGGVGLTDHLAERRADGWASKGITPTPALNTPLQIAFGTQTALEGFSEELDSASLEAYNLPNVGGGIPNAYNLYSEDLGSGGLTALSRFENPSEPLSEEFGPETLLGHSGDMSVIVFRTTDNLLPQAHGSQMKLYEFDHGTLKLAGVLPDGSVPAGGADGVRGGAHVARIKSADLTFGDTVSRDGSRVFFVSPIDGSAPQQLYVRRNASETVWISRPETSGESFKPTGVEFQAATPDGKKVLFNSNDRLLDSDPPNASGGLYMYTESPNPETEPNLTLIAAGRGKVIGISEDGTHVYYAAGGALFLWDEGRVQQVAPVLGSVGLSGYEVYEYPPFAENMTQVIDGGKRLVFMSQHPLGDREFGELGSSSNGTGGVASKVEVFLYDEETRALRCVSCPQTGEVPIDGGGVDPTVAATTGSPRFEIESQVRYASSDGKYIFFNTTEALVPQDTNGVEDAYEYNVQTGKLSLLSTGTGEDGTWFVEASPDGHDAFLATRQQLSGWDVDNLVDLYDARIDGGFPGPPPAASACQGEECQGIPGAAPDFSTASGFSGLGNLKPSPVTTGKTSSRSAKLHMALRACKRKHSRRSRARCEARARKRFAVKGLVKRRARRVGR